MMLGVLLEQQSAGHLGGVCSASMFEANRRESDCSESISVVDNWEPQHLSYMRKCHAVETAHLCRDMIRVPPTSSFNP